LARRKRSRRPEGEVSAVTPVDPDVARFAARAWQQQADERDRKRAAREARQREELHQTLIAAKDAAASDVKRLRMHEYGKAGAAAAADGAYRQALADLIAFETGAAPAWAASGAAGDVETDAGDNAASEAGPGESAGLPDGGDVPDEQG
jgi:hypothetical protein